MMTIDVLPYVLCHLYPDYILHPFHNKFPAYIQRNLDLTNKVTARYWENCFVKSRICNFEKLDIHVTNVRFIEAADIIS